MSSFLSNTLLRKYISEEQLPSTVLVLCVYKFNDHIILPLYVYPAILAKLKGHCHQPLFTATLPRIHFLLDNLPFKVQHMNAHSLSKLLSLSNPNSSLDDYLVIFSPWSNVFSSKFFLQFTRKMLIGLDLRQIIYKHKT